MIKKPSYQNSKHQQQSRSRLEWAESSWTRYLHILCWWWVSPLLSRSYKQKLSENDLDDIPYIDKSSVLLNRLNSYDWTSTTTSMIVAKEFWKDYMYTGLYFIPYFLVRIAQPLLLRQIILNTMHEDKPWLNIYLSVMCLLICIIISTFTRRLASFFPTRVGIQIRNALSMIILTRALSMKSTAWQQTNTGHVINLIANDAAKFEDTCKRLHSIWIGPLEILIVFIFLCWIIHPIPTLCGFTLFPLFILLQLYFSQKFDEYQVMTAVCRDRRIHAFSEFIHGSYVIKMYNWEKLMDDRIHQLREHEFKSIKHASRFRASNMIQFFISIPLLALTTFGSAWFLGYPLNPANTFTTLAFFTTMRVDIIYSLPLAIEALSDLKSASSRIDSFIRLAIEKQHQSLSLTRSFYQQEKGSLILSDASFSWNDDKVCLSSLDLIIEPSTFLVIVGPVGSGKSSLLAAILGEMNLLHGELITNNNQFAYVPQSSWIFADTIRNNIILNKHFDERRYRDVIYACCLDVDLSAFGTSGDLTMVGEKGVNLSGGQKARVSLARALYANADVYLLDDPLAAVDSTVAKQIYQRCIGSHGLLKDKTRLLVTHQTKLLTDTYQIVFLSNGHIDKQGSLDDQTIEEDSTNENKSSVLTSLFDETKATVDVQPIIAEETSMTGDASGTAWYRLFTAPPFGRCSLCLLIIFLLVGEILYDISNYWLSLWVERSHTNEQRSPRFAYIYLGLTMAIILADILRVSFYFLVILSGSNYFHNHMLKGLLYTSIEFFESNPSGRILSRVSKDQKIIDEVLPITLLYAIVMTLMTAGSLLIICCIHPYISLLILALIPLFFFLIRFYLRSSRQLKRLESVTRSPVYDLFSSSLHGLPTIRAFTAQDHFINLLTKKMDVNTCAYMYVQGASNWIVMCMDLMCCFIMLAICVEVLVSTNTINPSAVAFSLTSAIAVPLCFQWVVRQFLDVDILVTSIEHIDAYAQLPCEEDDGGEKRLVNTSSEWPSNGLIEFRNYSLRHRSTLDYVLKNINLRIQSGQKVGIIGRTGAGKSSLFKGIFRCIARSNIDGQLLIDDVDISRITLTHLRSHLSVIPQQSILFSGTLRYNLDPFNQYTDEQCWMTLDDVQLKQFVGNHSAGLLMPIAESGNNLSVGECQLICIARAILKKSKILLIDEATANVDQKTDETIQTVITQKFQDRTVLTIAHRLNTVARSDRILVLDKGMMLKYDTPMNVLHYYQ